MVTYTPEGKAMVCSMIAEANHWGVYSEKFLNELHKKLSLMHLREDNIYITYVEFKSDPNHADRSVKFCCEISLKWERGIVGGLVWQEFNQTFGMHT